MTSIKLVFTEAWLQFGDRMSDQVGDNLVFVSALRLFLPTYDGPILTLLRGDLVLDLGRAELRRIMVCGQGRRQERCLAGSAGLDWRKRGSSG